MLSLVEQACFSFPWLSTLFSRKCQKQIQFQSWNHVCNSNMMNLGSVIEMLPSCVVNVQVTPFEMTCWCIWLVRSVNDRDIAWNALSGRHNFQMCFAALSPPMLCWWSLKGRMNKSWSATNCLLLANIGCSSCCLAILVKIWDAWGPTNQLKEHTDIDSLPINNCQPNSVNSFEQVSTLNSLHLQSPNFDWTSTACPLIWARKTCTVEQALNMLMIKQWINGVQPNSFFFISTISRPVLATAPNVRCEMSIGTHQPIKRLCASCIWFSSLGHDNFWKILWHKIPERDCEVTHHMQLLCNSEWHFGKVSGGIVRLRAFPQKDISCATLGGAVRFSLTWLRQIKSFFLAKCALFSLISRTFCPSTPSEF